MSKIEEQLDIVLIEPFLTGSHAAWARELAENSRHRIEILGLDGRYWKWRMHGGAVELADRFLARELRPDLLLASDMLDLSSFLALTRRQTAALPVALYFHENQLCYPWSPDDRDVALKRDAHYAFMNYTSALAADALLFNSAYHRNALLAQLPEFLNGFPDYRGLGNVARIAEKGRVLPLGLDLRALDGFRPDDVSENEVPLILWNHRWEYDKNPEEFFRALYLLADEGIPFQLAVLGEEYRKTPSVFTEARQRLKDQIVHWGYAKSRSDYARWLWRADILPVTSVHDFFGISVVEAIYCGCLPLLPKRLAYPEHLPETLVESCSYDTFDGLVNRLRQHCRHEGLQADPALRDHVARYDWRTMVLHYDRCFSELFARGAKQA